MRTNSPSKTFLAGVALAVLASSAALAQQAPYAPGDMQNRQIQYIGSSLELLNLSSDNGIIGSGGFALVVQPGLTSLGTNLATAYNLTTQPGAGINLFSTVGAGTGVSLSGNTPFCALAGNASSACFAGSIGVTNAGANDLLVYPQNGAANIDGGAAGAAVALPPNSTCFFSRVAATQWITGGCSLVQSIPAAASATWRTTDTVTAGTAFLIPYFPWLSGTVQSVSYGDATGTFTAQVTIGGTSVTGCNALSVTSTPTLTACTGANILARGNQLSVVVSAPSGSPNGAWVQANYVHSALGS